MEDGQFRFFDVLNDDRGRQRMTGVQHSSFLPNNDQICLLAYSVLVGLVAVPTLVSLRGRHVVARQLGLGAFIHQNVPRLLNRTRQSGFLWGPGCRVNARAPHSKQGQRPSRNSERALDSPRKVTTTSPHDSNLGAP